MKTVKILLMLSLGISCLALVALDASDFIFQSRMVPWTIPLIKLQGVGATIASHFFQCKKEGFDTACEWFKVMPTIVLSNAIVYFIILTPVRYAVVAFKHRLTRSATRSFGKRHQARHGS
jgi:hypothetical protein